VPKQPVEQMDLRLWRNDCRHLIRPVMLAGQRNHIASEETCGSLRTKLTAQHQAEACFSRGDRSWATSASEMVRAAHDDYPGSSARTTRTSRRSAMPNKHLHLVHRGIRYRATFRRPSSFAMNLIKSFDAARRLACSDLRFASVVHRRL
jgi:hypothetical protein